MMDLVLYKYQNLTNNKSTISRTTSNSSSSSIITSAELNRDAGAIVTNSKLGAKVITMDGQLNVPSALSITLSDLITEYDAVLNKNNGVLRIMRNYTEISDCDSTTGWSVGDDGTNLTGDTNTYQYGTASLNFDLNAYSSGYLTLTNSTLTQVDLSSVDETGSFCFWLNIPDSANITTIDFRVGNDSSNYWGGSQTSNYEGSGIDHGWNFMSFHWSDMTETGAVDPSAIDYVLIQINYNSSQGANTDFMIDGVFWNDEGETRNYRVYKSRFNKDDEHYNITHTKFNLEFYAYEGLAFSTFTQQAFSSTGMVNNSEQQDITFAGSAEPRPTIKATVNDSTGLSSLTFTNNNNSEAITVAPASWSDSDVVIINTKTKSVSVNGDSTNFTGVIPRFETGLNKLTLDVGLTGATDITQDSHDTGIWGSSANDRFAQKWTATVNGTVSPNDVQVYGKADSPTGGSGDKGLATFVVSLQTNSSGSPSGTALWTAIVSFNLSTGTAEYRICGGFGSATITNTTLYWLVMTPFYSSLGDDYRMNWKDDSANPYAGGLAKTSTDGGSSYSTLGTADFRFIITQQPTASTDIDWSLNYKTEYS